MHFVLAHPDLILGWVLVAVQAARPDRVQDHVGVLLELAGFLDVVVSGFVVSVDFLPCVVRV